MDFNFTDWWQKQNNLGRVLIGALIIIPIFIGGQLTPPRPETIHIIINFGVLLTTIGLYFLNTKGKTRLAAYLFLGLISLPLYFYYLHSLMVGDFFYVALLASILVVVNLASNFILSKKSALIFLGVNSIFLFFANQAFPAPLNETYYLQQLFIVLLIFSTAYAQSKRKTQQLEQSNNQIQTQNQTLLTKLTTLTQQIEASSQELKHIKTQNQHLYQENTAIQQQNQHIQQQNTHLQQANKRLQSELMAAYKKADVLLEDLKQHKQSLKQSTQEKLLALTRLEETQKLLDILYEKSGDTPPPPLGEVHLVGTVGNEKHPKPYNDNGDIIFTLHVVNLKKPQYLFKYKMLLSGNMARCLTLAPATPLYVVGDLKTMYTKHIIRRTKRGMNIPGVDMPQIHVTFIQTLDEDDLQLNKTFGVYINTLRTYHLRQSDNEEN